VHVFFPKHLSLRRAIESAWADTPLTRPRLDYEADEKVSAVLRWFRGELHPTLGPTDLQKEEMIRRTRFDEPFPSARRSANAGSSILKHVEQELIKQEQDIHDLDWADQLRFGELTFSAQRVALFLRAVIRNPDVVVLDEAFSGMDDFARDKCHLFLSRGETAVFKWRTTDTKRLLRTHGPRPMESDLSRLRRVRVHGLTQEQALIIVSHKKEEVPGCMREWICLPEAGEGAAPRMGELTVPLELGINGWREIWNEGVIQNVDGTLSLRAKVPKEPQEIERKLKLRRERKKGKYEQLDPAQKRRKLEQRAATLRRKMANETEEQREKRLKNAREYQKKWLLQPDPTGEAATFYERALLRTKRRRENEAPERRDRRLAKCRERHARILATETLEEKEQRRADNMEAQRRRNLTEAQKEAKREYQREWARRKLAAMTEEEREAFKAKRRFGSANQRSEDRTGAWPRLLAKMGPEKAEALKLKRKAYMAAWREKKLAEGRLSEQPGKEKKGKAEATSKKLTKKAAGTEKKKSAKTKVKVSTTTKKKSKKA
jgi:hypothetical protein